jgi:hypothetical protein
MMAKNPAAEAIPGTIAIVADDRLHNYAHERSHEPEPGKLVHVGAIDP